MKQIILITDGCSNEGVSPVVAAGHAFADGIVVNVIGVVETWEMNDSSAGAGEIADIAGAGGGMSRMVSSKVLSQTVQMMTRKTVAHTIHQVVNKELHAILGETSLEQLPPDKRSQIVQVIDEMGETADLYVALLIDASASMKPKLPMVEEAIRDLMLSLQARKGVSKIAVFHFPGHSEKTYPLQTDLDWTDDLARTDRLFHKLSMKGSTPTGPALLKAMEAFTDLKLKSNELASSQNRKALRRDHIG